jgi:uncharacterized Fe-S cluster protein YjdI
MRKRYAAEGIEVSYDPALCIHAARCVRGAPAVFDPQARPWIRPERDEPAKIVDVIRQCPTGALLYELPGGPPEEPDAAVTVAMERNGPLEVRGRVRVEDGRGEAFEAGPRFALCRCGGSANKPFCDNTHKKIEFEG